MSRTAQCELCELDVDLDAFNIYYRAEGWIPRRQQGGANVIRAAKPLGQVAHRDCVDALVRGLTNQPLW